MYKYEMHLHSRAASRCSSSDSTEYVYAAKKHGYAGIVFTNHFFRGNTAIDKDIPWRDFVEQYHLDYLAAKELGDKLDIDVIFGLEEGYGKGKECLIYGLCAEEVAEFEDFSKAPVSELSAYVRSKGGFIACAHPFRVREYIKNPDEEPDMSCFDAVEVYNRGNTPEDNIRAEEFVRQNRLLSIAGGDVHNVSNFGHSGIVLPERVKTEKELSQALKSGNFKLIFDTALANYGELTEDFNYKYAK